MTAPPKLRTGRRTQLDEGIRAARKETKKKPPDPDRTPEVEEAIKETKAYLLKCKMGPDLGDPIIQMALNISTLAKTSTTHRQALEMEKRGVPSWERYPLDEDECRKLFERAKAGSCDADVLLRRYVRNRVRATRPPPVLAEYVEWALHDDIKLPREESFRSRNLAIASAVGRLQLQGYKRHAKPRKGKPNAYAFWMVGVALGELKADGHDIGVTGTSPHNIEMICRGVPFLRSTD